MEITGGTVRQGILANGQIHGGYVFGGSGSASDNYVHASNVTLEASVFGGNNNASSSANPNREASANSVTFDTVETVRSTISETILNQGSVYGGYAWRGNAFDNRVELSRSVIDGDVGGGGTVFNGSARGNSVLLDETTVKAYWHTGDDQYYNGNVYGGLAASGGSLGNELRIRGNSDVMWAYSGSVESSGNANDNSVYIEDGLVREELYGGYTTSGVASGNAVVISGGTVGDGVDGIGNVYGGLVASGTAEKNLVAISNGLVRGDVYGGLIVFGAGGAESNAVEISGGTVEGDIYGGYVRNGNAINNRVSLSGTPVLADSILFGGDGSGGGDHFSGNTLDVAGFNGSIKGIRNFENMSFAIPATMLPGGTLIHITGSDAVDLSLTNITVTMEAGGQAPAIGDRYTLIDSTENRYATGTVHGGKGGLLQLDYSLLATDRLELVLTGMRLDPRTKALLEGRAAGLALQNQAADLAAGAGVEAIAAAYSADAPRERGGPRVFGAMGGGWSRYKTGSHVDLSGVNALTGLAWAHPFPAAVWRTGVFFEFGRAHYDSANSFAGMEDVRGKGDADYAGGGIITRADWQSGWHVEGGFRTGSSETDFRAKGYDNQYGQAMRYRFSSPYYGAHAAARYSWFLPYGMRLMVGGEYFWSRLPGKNVDVSGETTRFDATDSHRAGVRTRLSRDLGGNVAWFTGVAFQYEFSGKPKATAFAYEFRSPALRGGTVMAEAGVGLKPRTVRNMDIELGVQGFAGRRQGVNGNLRVTWTF